MLRINYGCGKNKWGGFINIDTEPSCEADLTHDITKAPLPYETGSVDEIYFIHVIEHIQKKFHPVILMEARRVLKPDGLLFVAYPEFLRCVENYAKNFQGKRDFWEATIYGRQLYPGDYHVALMDSKYFKQMLEEIGFEILVCAPEPGQEFNTYLRCKPSFPQRSYEETIRDAVWLKSTASPID